MITKKTFFPLICLLCGIVLLPAQEFEEPDSVHYIPKIQGTIRAKYEYNVSTNEHRFQVRNARISATGNICPIVSYKAEIDLSDEGETKMLDAWIRYMPMPGWEITVGQQKVPFSTENLRSPHQYYFANRSFIGKQMSHDVRDVGLMVSCSKGKQLPFIIAAGIYNGQGIYNQKEWQKDLNFAIRTVLNPSKQVHFSLSMNSVKPDAIRMNLFDGSAFWQIGNLHLEGEYVYKYYERHVFDDTHSALAFACYDFPITKLMWLNKISPVLRYDMMTNNNRGIANSDGNYITDDAFRQRITGGVIFSLAKPFSSDIRINYEHYFYQNGVPNNDNKIVLECCVRF